MTTPQPDYNDWHIEVIPRAAGDFGGMYISTIRYDEAEAERTQKEMIRQIERHVDTVYAAHVRYDTWYCGSCKRARPDEHKARQCCTEDET